MVGNEIANQANGGVLSAIKEKIQPGAIMERLQVSRNTLIDIGLYGGIGFLAGFLLKKYSTFVIALTLFVTGLIMLQQFDFMVIAINWPKVHTLLGIQPATIIADNMFLMIWAWMRANVVISSSFIVGFLIGLKVG